MRILHHHACSREKPVDEVTVARHECTKRDIAGTVQMQLCRESALAKFRLSFLNLGEQLRNGHLERICQALHHCDRRVTRAALDAADIGTVNPVLERELLLSKPSCPPQAAQIGSKALAHVHRRCNSSDVDVLPRTMSIIVLD